MILSLRGMVLILAVGLLLWAGTWPGGALAQEPAEEESVPLLTAEQINVIKVWELPTDLSDLRLTIRVPREVMLEVFDRYRDDSRVPKGRVEQQAFLRRPMEEQLGLLFDLSGQYPAVREYYKDVQINGEPSAMIEFRRQVYGNYIQRYFRRLFGDGQVPGLRLATAPNDPLGEMYTNFYILSMAEHGRWAMIDRRVPQDSLLLQWGLPREAAKHPAPDVPGWRPMFRGLDDPNFLRMAESLDLLYDNPAYGLDYRLPSADDAQ